MKKSKIAAILLVALVLSSLIFSSCYNGPYVEEIEEDPERYLDLRKMGYIHEDDIGAYIDEHMDEYINIADVSDYIPSEYIHVDSIREYIRYNMPDYIHIEDAYAYSLAAAALTIADDLYYEGYIDAADYVLEYYTE